MLRLGRPIEALSALGLVDFGGLSHDDAGELLSLKATALCLLRDPDAENVLIEARVRAYSSGCPAVECEVEYVAAMAAWTQGRGADALSCVDTVLAVSEKEPSWLRKSRPEASCSSAYWRVRALDLRGLSQAMSEDFCGQANSLIEAFAEFDKGSIEDVYVEASMLYNLAVLARDVEAPDVVDFVANRATGVEWNSNTLFFEYEVYKALGWCHAQKGDHLGAFRYLRRSAEVAPTAPLKILAILDRSFLARELGELFTATEDIEYAVRLTSGVDWESVSGAERSALYGLANQVASFNPKQARRLWERFAALKTAVSPLELYSRCNRRERAAQCQAHAAVLFAEGRNDRAILLLNESYNIWSDVGYRWRAAMVAADLAEHTQEMRFFNVAQECASQHPNSWLARRIKSLAGHKVLC